MSRNSVSSTWNQSNQGNAVGQTRLTPHHREGHLVAWGGVYTPCFLKGLLKDLAGIVHVPPPQACKPASNFGLYNLFVVISSKPHIKRPRGYPISTKIKTRGCIEKVYSQLILHTKKKVPRSPRSKRQQLLRKDGRTKQLLKNWHLNWRHPC